MKNKNIHERLEEAYDILNFVRLDLDEKIDVNIITRSMELIEVMMWRFEEE